VEIFEGHQAGRAAHMLLGFAGDRGVAAWNCHQRLEVMRFPQSQPGQKRSWKGAF
jgi:hypothetical protein